MNHIFLKGICSAWLMFAVGVSPVSAKTQQLVISADQQFSYAADLYRTGDHGTAEVEFKRFVHFFPDDPRTHEAAFHIGMALFHQKKYYDAARQFDSIIRQDVPDRLTHEAYFMQSRAFIQMGNTGYAQTILQNFLMLSDDTDIRDRIHLELARLHIHNSRQAGTNELDMAKRYLEKISEDDAGRLKKEKYVTLVNEARNVPEKNPVMAGLAAVIPGGGFLYCERYQDALVSFGLNAGLMLAAFKAFDDGNTALGGVISFVGTGFYSGSIYGAVSAAHKHNHANRLHILNREFSFGSAFDPEGRSWALSFNYLF